MRLRYRLASALLAFGVLWILSGLFVGRAAVQEAAPGFKGLSSVVKVTELRAEDREVVLKFAAEVHASKSMDILAEVSGKVESVAIEGGGMAQQGEIILKIEERGRVEMLNQAKALYKQRQLERGASQSLSSTGYRSEAQDNAALVALMAAAANLKNAQIELGNTEIRAPFSGIVDNVMPQVGSFVRDGQVVARIVNFDQLKVVFHVSEKVVSRLTPSGVVEVVLGAGEVLRGNITLVSRIAAQGTKTYTVEALVDNRKGVFVTEGMASLVRVPVGTLKAHKIPSSALSLDDTGAIGVKVLDAQSVVQFFEVEIIDELDGQLWVSGAPDDVSLVELGHEYVTVGMQVNV
ncbi:MAG: efflux RND transporter periplasmic adaptor subunit [Anaplasma sp.]